MSKNNNLTEHEKLMEIGKQIADGFYEGMKQTYEEIVRTIQTAVENEIPKEWIVIVAAKVFGFGVSEDLMKGNHETCKEENIQRSGM